MISAARFFEAAIYARDPHPGSALARALGLSRAKSGVPDFAIKGAEAGNTPLRVGEEEGRRPG